VTIENVSIQKQEKEFIIKDGEKVLKIQDKVIINLS